MVLMFHVSIFDIFLEDKKGIGDIASIRLSLHGVILSPGGPPSPKFSRVPLVDVFVTICFLRERVVSPLPNPPLFSAGLGTVQGRSLVTINYLLFSVYLLIHDTKYITIVIIVIPSFETAQNIIYKLQVR